MSKSVLLAAVVAALIAGVATYVVDAQLERGQTEVRISAQRIDDGRVEFALQQRDSDGDWGDRILPASRYFPAEGFVNRWANSTPLTLQTPNPYIGLYTNDTQPTRALTFSQYLGECNSYTPADFELTGTATWGELAALSDARITELRSFQPPTEVADYHRAQVDTNTVLAQYFSLQPATETLEASDELRPFSTGAIRGAVVILFLVQLLEEAEAALDPGIRQRMIAAGCITDHSAP